ncbi:MAG: WecB/TagA/CpsF family glycosyltransferase [bacterium]
MFATEIVALVPTDPHVGRVLGVKVSGLRRTETVDYVLDLVESGESHQVCTAHAVGLYMASHDPELAEIYNGSSLVTCDSEGVRWALQRTGHPVEKVPGIDLVERLCEVSAEKGTRLFFFGSKPGIALDAAEKMREKYPGVVIIGGLDGYQPADTLSKRLQEIKAQGVDILLIGMGVPLQERVAQEAQRWGIAAVSIGVGGTFDVLSGHVKRAPRWMQQAHLEWLWRMLVDLRKAKRVAVLPLFALKVLLSK